MAPTAAASLNMLDLVAGSHFKGHYFVGTIDQVLLGTPLSPADTLGRKYAVGVTARIRQWLA